MSRIESDKQDSRPQQTPSGPSKPYRCATCGAEVELQPLIKPQWFNSPKLSKAERQRRGCDAARPAINVARELAAESASINREE